jgi:hypothetical protein
MSGVLAPINVMVDRGHIVNFFTAAEARITAVPPSVKIIVASFYARIQQARMAGLTRLFLL